MVIKRFFVPSAYETPGKLYKIKDGVESVYYARSNRRIYSAAFSKTGQLYFVNANEYAIYRVVKFLCQKLTLKIHTHTTYVRDIAFDSQGNLYFSEATGAGGDGKIYRLTGGSGSPTLFREVELSAVDGFWAGNFTFDSQDNLYISSGNRIPASIFRFADGAWEVVYTDKSEPIKGLTFLACDLLCYANFRSEAYLLDVRTSSRDLMYSNPIHQWISDVALLNPQIEENTMYEGTKVYTCDSTCWRDDGSVEDRWWLFFPDIHMTNSDITAMLSDIGVPTAPTTDDNEIWNRTRAVWAWLQTHTIVPGAPNFSEVDEYRDSLGHWPSIADLAHMFVNWGGFGWGSACTCMCRAQILATLLYRAGIPSDRMAIAETKWKLAYSQHMYIVIKIGCHWYYIDPSVNIPALSETPENVGSGTRDYLHPNDLKLFPASTITKPMLVR